MLKKQPLHVLGHIQATQGARLNWAIKLGVRGGVRFICAVPSSDIEAHEQSNNSFELKIGRDFLIAISAHNSSASPGASKYVTPNALIRFFTWSICSFLI